MRGLQPAAEVRLFNGGMTATTVAIFDSGSPYTVFSPEHAALIGIEDVMVGTHENISTLGGPREIYFFDLEIQLPEAGPRLCRASWVLLRSCLPQYSGPQRDLLFL